jgi:hypothetical protein
MPAKAIKASAMRVKTTTAPAAPASGVIVYFDGTDVKLKNAAGQVFTFTGSWA